MTDREAFTAWWNDPPNDGPIPAAPVSKQTAQWIWQAATLAERERNRLEMAGVVQVIASHANQLQNFAGNLDAQNSKKT